MLVEDPNCTHVAAGVDQIAVLYEATNQPQVQPQGRAAQAAQAVVVAVTNGAIYQPLVALTLSQTGENVVYAGQAVTEGELQQAVEEALNFAESMGFILDSGWLNLDDEQKAELLERLPAFHPASRRQKQVPAKRAVQADGPVAAVARLMAAFSVVLAASLFACSGPSAEQRAQGAEIHQQLGDNLLHEGNAQEALKEYRQSLELDETPEAHLGVGLIYTWSLGRPQEGEAEFKRALAMRPDYSEAQTNLGALYISRGRFADAVPLLEKAAADPLYKARVLAQSDLGWALYKSGQPEKGIGQIKGALVVAPKYCLGWRQLGTIYSEGGRLEEANDAFSHYTDSCPEVPDAWLQAGKVLARLSRAKDARAAFEKCATIKSEKDKPVTQECTKFLREMGNP